MIIKVKKTNTEEKNKENNKFKYAIYFVIGLLIVSMLLFLAFNRATKNVYAEENTNVLLTTAKIKTKQYTSLNVNQLAERYGTSTAINFTLCDKDNVPLQFNTTNTEFLDGEKRYYINVQINRMMSNYYTIQLRFYSDYAQQTQIFSINYNTLTTNNTIYLSSFSSTNYNNPYNMQVLQNDGIKIGYYETPTTPVKTGMPLIDTSSNTYMILSYLLYIDNTFLDEKSIYNKGYDQGIADGESTARNDIISNPKTYGLYTKNDLDNEYNKGVEDAQEGLSFSWFKTIFSTISSCLSIKIFGDISLGMIALIPLSISVVWFIIRAFGGGKD